MAIALKIAGLLMPLTLLMAGCGTASTAIKAPAEQLANVLTQEQQADAAYRSADLERAAGLYLQLTKLVPQEANYWYLLGNTYVRLQQPEQAVIAYNQAILRDPNHARAWHNLGIVRLREAEAAFVSSASTAKPDDPMHGLSSHLADDLARIGSPELEPKMQAAAPQSNVGGVEGAHAEPATTTPLPDAAPILRGASGPRIVSQAVTSPI